MARGLSIFVDESGDLGEMSDWYLVSLVLRDQADSLSEPIAAYEQALRDRGLPDIPMHTGPLITGHDDYENIDIHRRRMLLATFRTLVQRLPFTYHTFAYRKADYGNDSARISTLLRRDLTVFLFDNLDRIQQYDTIKIYYDNWQGAVTEALHAAIGYVASRNATVYRNIQPARYRLFQVADYACTVELTAIKYERGEATRSDQMFFGDLHDFRKKHIDRLRRHLM